MSMTTRLSTPQGPSLEQTSLPILNSAGPLILGYLALSSRAKFAGPGRAVARAKGKTGAARRYAA